jgi:hypothetical protein
MRPTPSARAYFDHLNAQRLTRYHTKRLAALGYVVTSRNPQHDAAPRPIYVGYSPSASRFDFRRLSRRPARGTTGRRAARGRR